MGRRPELAVAYEQTDIEIRIFHIIHSARDWKLGAWPDD